VSRDAIIMLPLTALVDQCRLVHLLTQLFLVVTSLVDSSHQSHAVTSRDQMTSSRTLLQCPSPLLSGGVCSCSVDLVVRCDGPRVTQLPQFPPQLDLVLAELNMAGTAVPKLLPVDIQGVRGIRRVVFTENQLSDDDDALSDDTFSTLGGHLRSLVLGACALRSLPPQLLIHLTQLTVLHLWSNRIEEIPNNFFVANSELRELSLWGNRLNVIHNRTFFGLHRLRLLDLDRNRITVVERGALGHVRDVLEVLRLSDNHISAVSDSTFSGLRRLRVLSLASNRLRFVDARTLAGLRQLRSLSLADNRIQFVADATFQHLVRLTTLNLSGNRLERVSDWSVSGRARSSVSRRSLPSICRGIAFSRYLPTYRV